MDDRFSPMRQGCRLRASRSLQKFILFCLEKYIEISAWKMEHQTYASVRQITPAGASFAAHQN